jgi:hypothetical protein
MYFLIAGYTAIRKQKNRILRELQQDLEMQCLEWLIGFFAAK